MKKTRKNYLPTLGLILVLWSLLGAMMLFIDPEIVRDVVVPGMYLPFFLLFFSACFLSVSVIVVDSKKGLLISLGLSGFLLLRIYGLGNLLNGLLIGGIVVAINQYWSS